MYRPNYLLNRTAGHLFWARDTEKLTGSLRICWKWEIWGMPAIIRWSLKIISDLLCLFSDCVFKVLLTFGSNGVWRLAFLRLISSRWHFGSRASAMTSKKNFKLKSLSYASHPTVTEVPGYLNCLLPWLYSRAVCGPADHILH